MNILGGIDSSDDIKKLDIPELERLCSEIRAFLLESVSKTGGHLSPNLGVVELTVAIHKVFDVMKDRIVFDVGHQSYTHKLLTGRLSDFAFLRTFGGISGFPLPEESYADAFAAGHASNSISAALGMARARTLQNADYKVACLIGDGALTGGLSYEAMNDAGQSAEPLVVILNDNGMSINKNVGAVAKSLANQRMKPAYYEFKKFYRKLLSKIPGGRHVYNFTHNVKKVIKKAILHCSMFEELGFLYLGPVDGHDLKKLIYFLNYAAEFREPVIVHVVTKKGKGYAPAEQNPGLYHGVEPFDIEKGVEKQHNTSFSAVFGETLLVLAEEDEKICAITAAMPAATGLTLFSHKYPKRFFDVGIAEGHAVTMAAGMAKQGLKPVFAVYSTFLQRSYDMLIHDAAISRLPIVFAVDRAGIVGEDGVTHQGIFDVGYLGQIPGITVFCPASYAELRDMLRLSFTLKSPVAVRYPRGAQGSYTDGGTESSRIVKEGGDITIIAYGILVNNALEASFILRDKFGIEAEVVKLGIIAPLDTELIEKSIKKTKKLAVIEDCVSAGSVGEKLAAKLLLKGFVPEKLILKNAGHSFVTHGSVTELQKSLRLDAVSIAEDIYW